MFVYLGALLAVPAFVDDPNQATEEQSSQVAYQRNLAWAVSYCDANGDGTIQESERGRLQNLLRETTRQYNSDRSETK